MNKPITVLRRRVTAEWIMDVQIKTSSCYFTERVSIVFMIRDMISVLNALVNYKQFN